MCRVGTLNLTHSLSPIWMGYGLTFFLTQSDRLLAICSFPSCFLHTFSHAPIAWSYAVNPEHAVCLQLQCTVSGCVPICKVFVMRYLSSGWISMQLMVVSRQEHWESAYCIWVLGRSALLFQLLWVCDCTNVWMPYGGSVHFDGVASSLTYSFCRWTVWGGWWLCIRALWEWRPVWISGSTRHLLPVSGRVHWSQLWIRYWRMCP